MALGVGQKVRGDINFLLPRGKREYAQQEIARLSDFSPLLFWLLDNSTTLSHAVLYTVQGDLRGGRSGIPPYILVEGAGDEMALPVLNVCCAHLCYQRL